MQVGNHIYAGCLFENTKLNRMYKADELRQLER